MQEREPIPYYSQQYYKFFRHGEFIGGQKYFLRRLSQLPSKRVLARQIDETYLYCFDAWAYFSLLLGDCHEAEAEISSLLRSFDAVLRSDYPLYRSRLLRTRADIRFYYGKYTDAQGDAQDALSYFEPESPKQSYIDYGRTLVMLGKATWKVGDLYLALDHYIQAWRAYQIGHLTQEDQYLSGRLKCLIGQVYLDLRDADFARQLLDAGITELKRALKADTHLFLGAAYNMLGRCYLGGNRRDNIKLEETSDYLKEAEQYLSEAQQIFDKVWPKGHTDPAKPVSSTWLSNQLKKVGQPPLHRFHCSLLGNFARLHWEKWRESDRQDTSKWDEAQKYYRAELRHRQAALGDNHANVGITHNNLARLMLEAGSHYAREAALESQKGLRALCDDFQEYKNLKANPPSLLGNRYQANRLAILQLLATKTDSLLAYYHYTQEKEWLELARLSVDDARLMSIHLRNDLKTQRGRLEYDRQARPVVELGFKVYSTYREVLSQQGHNDPYAFKDQIYQLVNLSKGLRLYEYTRTRMQESNKTDHEAPLSTLKEELQKLLEPHLLNPKEALTPEEIEQALGIASDRINSWYKQYLEQAKRYSPDDLCVEDLWEAFTSDPPGYILNYVVGVANIWVVGIGSKGGFFLVDLNLSEYKVQNIKRMCKELIERLDQHGNQHDVNSKSEFPFHIQFTYNQLYQHLIAPLENELNQQRVQRLYIIPDEELHFLPFEALAPWSADIDNIQYLLKQYQISYHLSVALLYNDHNNQGANHGINLKLLPGDTLFNYGADVIFKADNVEVLASPNAHMQETLGAVRDCFEHDCKLSTVPSTLAQHDLLQSLKEAKVIHLFVHTREKGPHLEIILNQDEQGNSQFLTVDDISKLKLREDCLVILNTCRSGRGQLEEHEGPDSLMRAFWEAGARNIYYTLFRINMYIAKELTKRLIYQLVNKKMPFSAALREAKLEIIAIIEDNAKVKKEINAEHIVNWSAWAFLGNQLGVVERDELSASVN